MGILAGSEKGLSYSLMVAAVDKMMIAINPQLKIVVCHEYTENSELLDYANQGLPGVATRPYTIEKSINLQRRFLHN